jgi:hypothetical protein
LTRRRGNGKVQATQIDLLRREAGLVVVLVAVAAVLTATALAKTASGPVWLCAPGVANDPCTASLTATRTTGTGSSSIVTGRLAKSPRVDCFYVYPTVSRELTPNADLKVQKSEITAAVAQASRFSAACRVFAPMYRQVTLAGLLLHPSLEVPKAEEDIAYSSLLAGFRYYLAHENGGRPIVFIGHSQGAAILIRLLAREVDANPALRRRLLLAILLGGDVEVKAGALTGGSYSHIPLCSRRGETGCVIAYSSFPGRPPASSLFGRVGQGVALQSGETRSHGLQVACVNPAALAGGSGTLDSFFPSGGAAPTPWVEFPGLYTARCETTGGATWLQVSKATGSSDRRPTVTETAGPDWGYHQVDVNLALGNLVEDVVASVTWARADHG